MSRRVVVTGLGALTPIGTGIEKYWQGLLDCRSGANVLEAFDTKDFSVHIGAEVRLYTGVLTSVLNAAGEWAHAARSCWYANPSAQCTTRLRSAEPSVRSVAATHAAMSST